jgi:hypothetical protein
MQKTMTSVHRQVVRLIAIDADIVAVISLHAPEFEAA